MLSEFLVGVASSMTEAARVHMKLKKWKGNVNKLSHDIPQYHIEVT